MIFNQFKIDSSIFEGVTGLGYFGLFCSKMGLRLRPFYGFLHVFKKQKLKNLQFLQLVAVYRGCFVIVISAVAKLYMQGLKLHGLPCNFTGACALHGNKMHAHAFNAFLQNMHFSMDHPTSTTFRVKTAPLRLNPLA